MNENKNLDDDFELDEDDIPVINVPTWFKITVISGIYVVLGIVIGLGILTLKFIFG